MIAAYTSGRTLGSVAAVSQGGISPAIRALIRMVPAAVPPSARHSKTNKVDTSVAVPRAPGDLVPTGRFQMVLAPNVILRVCQD